VHRVEAPVGAVGLGHGAGGSGVAPYLMAVTRTANAAGFAVVLVEQPNRAAGRKAPARAQVLDAAWQDVVAHLCDDVLPKLPLVVGGRSAGARVARPARLTRMACRRRISS